MGLSSLWPLSSIEMYFSLVPSMDAALTWLTFAARLAATSSTPVLGDRVPVHAVPPRDLAEVRLRAGPPVDVQLSHYVSLHIPLLPGRIPDRSIVPLAQLVKVR